MVQDGQITDYGLDAIGTSAAWLRAHLDAAGVRLHPDSGLARALDELEELVSQIGQVARFPSAHEAYRFYLRASGVDFLSKALHRGRALGLEGFNRHVKTLASGDPVLTGPAEAGSEARNASWELLLASLVASFAEAVEEREPDVVCAYQGARIGIAAKVLYSKNPDQLLKQVLKGAQQLEKSQSDHGFVVVNLVEVFPHTRMFDNFREARIASGIAAQEIIHEWMNALLTTLNFPSLVERLARRTSKKLNSVMFFVPTVLHMEGIDPPFVPFYRYQMITIDGRRERAEPFEYALNSSCQGVLGYRRG